LEFGVRVGVFLMINCPVVVMVVTVGGGGGDGH
jgi:hypothetical protein